MQLLRQLVRYTGALMPLACMIVLTAFSVGYSLFISAMTRGDSPEAALRFTALNFLYGVLARVLDALVVVTLARRAEWKNGVLLPPRLGVLFGVVAGLFLLEWLVFAIWPVILAGVIDASDAWYTTVYYLPSLALQVALFPLVVWQVVLARGAGSPRLGEIWREVWSRWAAPALVLFFAAAALGLQQLAQPVLTSAALPRPAGLIFVIVPSAIAIVFELMLAIVVCRDMDRRHGEIAVFS